MKTRNIFIGSCICLFVFPVALVAQDYYIQWADTIDNGGFDAAQDVAVDNSNNIIVTGYADINADFDYDYFTVKYDSNGTILWQDAIDNGVADIARSVAVDNANNIIVTGQCIITGDPYCHYFTVKYDSNGIIQWADTIVNSRHDNALGVAVDNSNNIIVTGYSVMSGPNCNYFTVKYDSNGTILWQDIIDNRIFDYAFGIATDNSNNIIVTGHSGDPVADYDYFTVKYDSNGMILWQDTTVGDIAYDVAVDNSNNIIVTGYCVKSGDKNYFTVKYDSNGAILWQDTLDNGGSDVAQGVAVDNFNDIIVTGFSELSDLDYFTVKYDSNGTILWQDTLDNSGDDFARGVAVDNSDNIIVTGTSFIDGDNDYFTVKYIPTSGISEDNGPDTFSCPVLCDIYPNPFSSSTTITFTLPSIGHSVEGIVQDIKGIELKIYDVSGRLVKDFSLSQSGDCSYKLTTAVLWDGRDNSGEKVTSGIFFLRLETGDYEETRQLLLIK